MRIRQLGAVCRVLFAAGLALAILTWAYPGTAAPGDSPADIAQRLVDAKNEANAAAARFTDAQSRYEQLGDKVAIVQQKIKVGEARAKDLHEVAKLRALVAYKTQGADISVIFETDDPLEGVRSSVLLNAANGSDKQAVAEYAEVAGDLAARCERKLGLELVLSLHDEHVREVDAGGVDFDQHLSGARPRIRQLADLEVLQGAVGGAHERFHAGTSG